MFSFKKKEKNSIFRKQILLNQFFSRFVKKKRNVSYFMWCFENITGSIFFQCMSSAFATCRKRAMNSHGAAINGKSPLLFHVFLNFQTRQIWKSAVNGILLVEIHITLLLQILLHTFSFSKKKKRRKKIHHETVSDY